MNKLQIFNNAEFGEVRTIDEGGKVLFCGSDVARALGYKRPNDAITAHCKGTVKRRTPTAGGTQQMLFIPEGDIYRLAAKSELPGAGRFESWIFDEVLPTIRKTGGYVSNTEHFVESYFPQLHADQKSIIGIMLDESKRMGEKLKEQAPKVLFADSVSASHTSILVGELAKLLRQNGVDIGQNRLFEWMRNNGFLIKRKGTDFNMPTQRSMDMGLFEIKETVITHSDGHVSVSKTPKISGKGQVYFIERFLSDTPTL